MVRIAPSILSADFTRLGDEIRAAEQAGADIIHIDVMDGHFVPNITIGYGVVQAVRKITRLPLDVHLMIEAPDRYIQNFIDAGSDILTVHYEAVVHLHRTVQVIREGGVKAGVSVNPATPVENLDDILADADMVLLMSVNPGFGGQKFIPASFERLKRLKARIVEKGLSTQIEIDGGIGTDNAGKVADAGADILVMGSAFFNSPDYVSTMETLNEILGRK
jgi:ribulose-phosphate 3-epimerase